MTSMNWLVICPEIWLLAAACAIAVADLFVTDPERGPTFWMTQAAIALFSAMHLWMFNAGLTVYGMQGMVGDRTGQRDVVVHRDEPGDRIDHLRRQHAGVRHVGILLEPDALVLGQAADTRALLKSASDAARCPGLKALIVECWGKCPELDLTVSRRLALAAEKSGVTLFLLRLEAEPLPSAADTRWSVSAAPSIPLEADAPGPPMFEIELLRRRSGPSGMRWRLEWDRDQIIFREPAHIGAVVPLPAGRPVAADPWRLSA